VSNVGEDIITWLKSTQHFETKEALELAQEMYKEGFFLSVHNHDNRTFQNDKTLYRFLVIYLFIHSFILKFILKFIHQ
jgi:hypothetical protein